MVEWIPVASTGAVLLVVLIVVLVKLHTIGSGQAELDRTLNLLMDTVESMARAGQGRVDQPPPSQPEEGPSIISYRKPKLTEDPQSRPPPPPPPPAKLKRW